MSLYNEFLDFENKNNMYSRKIDNVNYWEYIRMFVHMKVQESTNTTDPNITATKIKLKNYLINIKFLKNYFLNKQKKKVDLLFISHPRRFYQNGLFENIYVDKISNYFSKKYKTLVMEEPTWSSSVSYHKAHLFPVKSENIYFTDFFELRFLLKRKLFPILHIKKYKSLLIEYEKILKIVKQGMPQYQLENIDFKDIFLDCAIRIKCMYKETEHLLQEISPKVVLLHYFPTYFKTMIIDICKQKNIPTIEIQHGTITADDPLVNKCKNKKVTKTVTDYIFGYGKNQIDTSDTNITKENIKMVGFPFLEEKIKEKIEKPAFMESGKKYILIISQSTIGNVLSKFAASLADQLKDDNDYKIIFKYHPNELHRDYKRLKKENIIEIKDYKNEIYSIQKYCNYQIGVYSTSLYEGLLIGIPTFIIGNIFGAEESIKIISDFKQGVKVINSVEEFKENMNIIKKPLVKDQEKLFANDSYNKYTTEIEKIMRKYYD